MDKYRKKAVEYLSISADISERRQVQERPWESEELHRIILSTISDAVFITDNTGAFTYICPNVHDIFGYSYEEAIALESIDRLIGIQLFDRMDLETCGEIKNIECVIHDKSGVEHILLVNIKLVSIKGGTTLFTCRDISERKRAEKALVDAEETIRKLSFNWLTAQEMERKRIASDLHDDLGQCLALLKLQIRNIQKNLLPKQNDLANECENSLKYTNQLIEKVRTLSHGLTPGMLDDIGLTASLKSLIKGFSKYAYIYIEKDIANIDKLFPPLSEITIYRIFQEILTNIEKHSGADFVNIVVAKHSDFVSFEIEDTGNGFDLERITVTYPNKGGLGLASIKERLQMLGGRIEIKSRVNKGTKIHFMIPFDQDTIMSKTSLSPIEPALTP